MEFLEARAEDFFTVVRQEVRWVALANDSEILVVLADYVQLFLLRDCENWTLAFCASEKTAS